MRHRKTNKKLGRRPEHRKAMLASLVCNLIEEKRITTTLAKAKLMRSPAEKAVTLARQATLTARRRLLSSLRQETRVDKLITEIVPKLEGRQGGYVRILKLGRRSSDSSEMAIVEWVGIAPADKKRKTKKEEEKKPEAAK